MTSQVPQTCRYVYPFMDVLMNTSRIYCPFTGEHVAKKEANTKFSFEAMDPVVKKSLEEKPEDENYQAIAFSFAFLSTGPRANQSDQPPFDSGKCSLHCSRSSISKALRTIAVWRALIG